MAMSVINKQMAHDGQGWGGVGVLKEGTVDPSDAVSAIVDGGHDVR